MAPDKDGCVLGAKNEQRIVSLERDMGKMSRMVFWAATSSISTLVSLVVVLIITLVRR